MPDTPVDRDPGLEARVARLEEDVREIKGTLAQMLPMLVRIDATMPHLATKAELAEKPGKAYLWSVMAVLLAAYAAGLAGLAVLR
jgi:hypothetical protein